jgi:predicted small lipoprotein YifL
MKKITLVFSVFLLVISLVGCGNKEDDGKLSLPISSSPKNANYEDIVTKFENAGFTNVQTEILDDLILGWLTKDGEVEEVSVDGYTTFSTGNRYPADVEIIVSYHTFPKDKDEVTTEPPTPEPPKATEPPVPVIPPKATEPPLAGDPPKAAQPTEVAPPTVKDEIITIDNNKEFAALLKITDTGHKTIKEFASKYAGRTIEFDGNIAYMNKHENYKTRYDFLVNSGDYSETSTFGPNFQFKDCNYYDLNLTGDNIPDSIRMGDNLHFVAKIEGYNEVQELFFLNPISTKVR